MREVSGEFAAWENFNEHIYYLLFYKMLNRYTALMKTVCLHCFVITAIVVISAILALLCATLFAEIGAFGSCFEGGCGYAALYVGFPLGWGILMVLGITLWIRWWRKRQQKNELTP